eukprot:6155691-Amphidinium_carterae.1
MGMGGPDNPVTMTKLSAHLTETSSTTRRLPTATGCKPGRSSIAALAPGISSSGTRSGVIDEPTT